MLQAGMQFCEDVESSTENLNMSKRKRKVTIDGETYYFNGWWWRKLATGEPVRDAVLLELRKHEPDFSTPRAYVNRHLGNPHRQICWRCKNQVNSTIHKTCATCEWVKCPNCGACGCQHWKYKSRYKNEQKLPGNRASSKRTYGKSGRRSAAKKKRTEWSEEPSSRKKTSTKRARKSPSKSEKSAKRRRDDKLPLPQPRFTPYLRRGVNRLLHDVYGRETLLSTILCQDSSALSDKDIEQLRTSYLEAYLLRLARAWRTQWDGFLDRRDIHILFRAYGLDGQPPSPRAGLDDILPRLRTTLRRRRLERIARVTARDVLGK